MNETRFCPSPDVLISYLYEDGDQRDRQVFDAHLQACQRCAREVADLRAVRSDLAGWTPPEAMLGFRIVREGAPTRRLAWLAVPALPAWAQFAAASLVVGIAVGLSGLDVRYDPQQGLAVHAGWSPAAGARPGGAPTPASAGATAPAAPWQADSAALREQLARERQQTVAAPSVTAPPVAPAGGAVRTVATGKAMSDEEFMARVRELVEASETRQRRELALRLTQVVRDLETQRRADLARVADGIGVLEGRTGAAVVQQRELMNYLMRVSQRQQ